MVVLVHPAVPGADAGRIIAYAKANPGKVNMASAAAAARRTWRASCSR
jgi:tripartite-type tricarboxylate transporter receptor subunit TctC